MCFMSKLEHRIEWKAETSNLSGKGQQLGLRSISLLARSEGFK